MSDAATQPTPLIPRYSLKDESDLLWYHGLGQTSFERSTFGGMLDRASAFANNERWPQQPVLNDAGACIGWESAITARPTAETREISGYVPDEITLTRYADVSKLMMRVERASPLAAQIIATFFGDVGQRWAAEGANHGRNGALYHLTAKGKALIEADEKTPGSIELSAERRMWNLIFVGASKHTADRKLAIAVCVRQSAALERSARAVWHMVKSI